MLALTLAWMDRHAALFAVAGVLILCGLVAAQVGSQTQLAHQSERLRVEHTRLLVQDTELKAIVHGQAQNRALNVGVWCQALNSMRDYSRQSLAAKHRAAVKVTRLLRGLLPAHVSRPLIAAFLGTAPPYTLPDLPCTALQLNTLASAR